jgi:hypothetical protein
LVVEGGFFDGSGRGIPMKAQEIIIVPACLVNFRLSGVFRKIYLSPLREWKEYKNKF